MSHRLIHAAIWPLIAVVAASLGLSASAAPVYTMKGEATATLEASPPARAPVNPADIVNLGLNGLAQYLAGNATPDPEEVRAFLDDHVASHFDFETMAKWAAGPFYWRLTPADQQRFHGRVRDLFLDALARNLGTYSGSEPSFQVFAPMMLASRAGPQISVRAQVQIARAYPIQIDFLFYHRDGRWRVFDVSAAGFSAVAYYRRYFAGRVRVGGIQALLEGTAAGS